MMIQVPDSAILEAAIREYERDHDVEHCDQCFELGRALAFSPLFRSRQQAILDHLFTLVLDPPVKGSGRSLDEFVIMMMKLALSYGLYAAAILEKERKGEA